MPREPALRNTCHGPRTSLPQRAFHPTDHVQQDISPPDNPPPSARKSGAGEARRRVGRRRGRLPSSARQSLRALVMQSSAPARGAPSQWDSALGAIEDMTPASPTAAKGDGVISWEIAGVTRFAVIARARSSATGFIRRRSCGGQSRAHLIQLLTLFMLRAARASGSGELSKPL